MSNNGNVQIAAMQKIGIHLYLSGKHKQKLGINTNKQIKLFFQTKFFKH